MNENASPERSGKQRARNALDVDWDAIHKQYNERPEATFSVLAREHGIKKDTLIRHAIRFGWKRLKKPRGTGNRDIGTLTLAADRALERGIEKISDRIVAEVDESLKALQPWIEGQRAKHVKRVVELSQKGLDRLEDLYKRAAARDPKAESFTAAAMEKLDNISRRNLGMTDGVASNTLNLGVLSSGGRTVITVSQKEQQEKQADVIEIDEKSS